MIEKIKLWNEKRKIIKFLNNVENHTRLFKYKITGSFFHLYLFGKTINMSLIHYYKLDDIIEIICYEFVKRNIRIKKEYFKGI